MTLRVRLLAPLLLMLAGAGCHRGFAATPGAPAGPAPPATAIPDVTLRPLLPPRPSPAGYLDASYTEEDLEELWARQMTVPVEGVTRRAIKDSYAASRSNNRTHAAIDIMAPRNTPVIAAADHIIGRLDKGSLGGIFIYATDPEMRFTFYYAHLERYRRGLAVGDRVAKGSIIGYVGTSGNAPNNLPHLHFQVMKRGTGRAWWDGPPINPLPFFATDGK